MVLGLGSQVKRALKPSQVGGSTVVVKENNITRFMISTASAVHVRPTRKVNTSVLKT